MELRVDDRVLTRRWRPRRSSGLVLGQVLVADVVGQHTEEDGHDLGAGNVVQRATSPLP